ncbi:4-carboxy-4-hydroxy-2-oxoadipate aldolase/oxaloacetate decarboxylase [Halorarum salinum]|uniref:4-carboxy-4-hydroxy-2-oxoadipate aldolase/oxaloacetate decarboxylase n=1 Tax=Halorarum salinum TaxID=2743089 RepID=A0A7D5L912_9EURY|nr:4-carboxy-4-hydroxy-2-oxoadipate aldolase/oxaloacetate decarboxylase [Halobaculum salinum]QLG61146.1 4-carboxy-4-hydroxy-2-oxoadipate aldolase/oxaloacetate decarboxylase [Halobaculum salinum]
MSDATYTVVEAVERPPESLVEEFRGLASSDVHEAMGKRGAMSPEITPATGNVALCGTAVTVSLPPGDNAGVHLASSIADPGDVLVVEAETDRAATWGELTTRNAMNAGIEGVVSGGNVRDVDGIDELGFAVFSRSVGQNGAVKQRPGSVNVPVGVGGVVVTPGDLVIGDADGVTVVPRERAAAVLEAAREKEAAEAELRRRMDEGEELPDLIGVGDLLEGDDVERVRGPVDYAGNRAEGG